MKVTPLGCPNLFHLLTKTSTEYNTPPRHEFGLHLKLYYATDARKILLSLTAATTTTYDEATEADGTAGDGSEASAEPKGPFLYDVRPSMKCLNSLIACTRVS